MKDRIREIRKHNHLTQVEFGKQIGVAGNTVTNYENGMREPSNAIICSICRVFGINENWLRNGEGEMFLPTDRNSDIARLTKQLLNEEPDSFKNRFISMLSNLTIDEWELLERKALELCGSDNNNNSTLPS